jgi:hypothetical protein
MHYAHGLSVCKTCDYIHVYVCIHASLSLSLSLSVCLCVSLYFIRVSHQQYAQAKEAAWAARILYTLCMSYATPKVSTSDSRHFCRCSMRILCSQDILTI